MAKQGKYVYDWPRPMVTVDAAVFADTPAGRKILLIQRGREPFKGQWAIPGGFIEMDEELEDAAARELAEETGLTNIELEQFYTAGTVGRDPRGRQITIVHIGFANPEQVEQIRHGDDAADARWFDIDELPFDRIAFDHDHISRLAIEEAKKRRP